MRATFLTEGDTDENFVCGICLREIELIKNFQDKLRA